MIKIIKYVLSKDELRFGQIFSGPAQRMGGNVFCKHILLFTLHATAIFSIIRLFNFLKSFVGI